MLTEGILPSVDMHSAPCLPTFCHNSTSFLLLGQLGTHGSPRQLMVLLSIRENPVMALVYESNATDSLLSSSACSSALPGYDTIITSILNSSGSLTFFFFALNTKVQSSNTASHSFYWADPEWTPEANLLICFRLLFQKKSNKISLVVQWFRICLPRWATWVWSLVWENPTCHGATRWAHWNYWSQYPLPDLVSQGITIPTATMKGRWRGRGVGNKCRENVPNKQKYLNAEQIRGKKKSHVSDYMVHWTWSPYRPLKTVYKTCCKGIRLVKGQIHGVGYQL